MKEMNSIRAIVFGYVNQLVPHKIDEKKLAPFIEDITKECEFLATEIDAGEFDEK
jgi:hypothetical protein